MSFLTTFPEDVYPTHSLAETIQTEAFDIELAQALMWMSQAAYETTADASERVREAQAGAHPGAMGLRMPREAQSGRHGGIRRRK